MTTPSTTVPLSITVTALRPDTVIVSETSRTINILELTVPTNTPEGLSNARSFKQSKYNSLVNDI